MADRKTFEMFLALTLIVKKRNATVEGERRRELQIKLRKGSTTVNTRPFWFASNNLRQNVLSRQRLKKQGLTNTSSPTRTFGFSAKAFAPHSETQLDQKEWEEKDERTYPRGDCRSYP